MVDAFHHLEQQEASLRELWRVLSPEGLLIIEEPDIREFAVKLIALAEKMTLFRSHFIPAEKIAHLLRGFGAVTEIYRRKPNVWIRATKK
jgi:ubiquinone/menaquinone biosynthesis C-methylase UbiE